MQTEFGEPEHFKFGGGIPESILHPIVVVAMFIAIAMLFLLPRKKAIAAFYFSVFLIPYGQQFVLAGIHFFVIRIIILAGLGRMLMSRSPDSPLLGGGWNTVDKAFVLWVSFHVVAFSLLYHEGAALVNQVGYIWDNIGGYFLIRYLIHDEEDIQKTIKCFAYLTVILALCMIREQFTGQNIFGLLGGVRLVDQIRNGRFRSEGIFQHAILAGTFAACLMPLFLWLWKSGKAKFLGATGAIGSTVMVLTTACSTPVLSLVAGFCATCLWPLRKHMRKLRWGIVISLVALQLVIHAPIWFLITRIDFVDGSSNFHRAELVDQFIRHTSEWWLLGTKSNGDWGNHMFDTSNQYVTEGTTGGIFALIFFIALISRSFARIGNARKALESMTDRDPKQEWFLWFLGAALFCHVVAYLGIDYFDQTQFAWFTLLAIISAATAPYLVAKPVVELEGSLVGARAPNARLAYPSASLSRATPGGSGNSLRKQFSSQPITVGRRKDL